MREQYCWSVGWQAKRTQRKMRLFNLTMSVWSWDLLGSYIHLTCSLLSFQLSSDETVSKLNWSFSTCIYMILAFRIGFRSFRARKCPVKQHVLGELVILGITVNPVFSTCGIRWIYRACGIGVSLGFKIYPKISHFVLFWKCGWMYELITAKYE